MVGTALESSDSILFCFFNFGYYLGTFFYFESRLVGVHVVLRYDILVEKFTFFKKFKDGLMNLILELFDDKMNKKHA